jgi:Domain of unknown function (DUF4386)
MNVMRFGGLALIAGALAFLGVFSYLAVTFNYPDVLDGPAATVLPALLATGATGRAVWTIYAFLPLIWIPAGVAAFEAYGAAAERRGMMRIAMFCALIASLAMMLGLMRWPSMHWHLAQAYVQADPPEQAVIAATFDGLNTYLGNFIGELLGEMAVSFFFLLTSLCWLRVLPRRRWMGWVGVATGIAGLIGMFRNVTTLVAPIAALNNYLLPVFMILLGGALIHQSKRLAASISV